MTKIHNLVKKEETKIIERQIEEIEKTKNDSTRMFKAIKDLNRIRPKIPLLIKSRNGYTANEEEQAKLIADYFKKQFWKNRPSLPDIQPSKMKIEFTKEEVQTAIKQLGPIESTYRSYQRTYRKFKTDYFTIDAAKKLSNLFE